MRITMNRLCILLFVVCPILAEAQPNTVIQGNAFFYRGKEVAIRHYLDLFTFKNEPLATQSIEEKGNFKFELQLDTKGIYLIRIGNVQAHVFIEPGEQYTLVIPEPQPEDRIGLAKDVFVQPEIFETGWGLNTKITELEKTINSFVIDFTPYFLARSIRPHADSFLVVLDSLFGNQDDAYFNAYFHFRKAEFEITTYHSLTSVYKKYFMNTPLHYHQLSFANAFKQLYADHMMPNGLKPYSDSLDHYLVTQQFSKALEALMTDPLINRTEERDLLFAYKIYELGKLKKLNVKTALALLDSIEVYTAHPEARMVAINGQDLLTKLAVGSKIPEIEFADKFGNTYRISEYAGQYLYIQFFDRFTPETIRQMSLMKVLKDGYGADIAMFSISTGESLKRLKEVPEDYRFDWIFGKAQHPDRLRDEFDLRALPMYYFVDPELTLVASPAPPPGERIERSFAKIWKMNHPSKAVPFKLQPPEVSDDPPPTPNPEKN
ncbi:MAG: hypothetical protein Kow0075_12470 [Salibacteraceae bacterium]